MPLFLMILVINKDYFHTKN